MYASWYVSLLFVQFDENIIKNEILNCAGIKLKFRLIYDKMLSFFLTMKMPFTDSMNRW